MRCAFVSDIHANLQAWKAVLLDIRSSSIDKIICLGDIVGYGPNPAEVLESVYASVDNFVLGNHDAVVCGKMDPALFNDSAQEIIAWTQKQLGPEAPTFLESLPLTLRAASFRCAHATFAMPASFDYIIEPSDALASWRAVNDPLLFVGHSHQPGIYVVGKSGMPHRLDPTDFVVEAGKRYLVNVGSVGQPRDGDTRASYCILDTNAASVHWRRVPFDLDAYREALRVSGIPEGANYFLKADPNVGVPPLRELLQFSPTVTPSHELQKTPEVQELSELRKRVRRLSALYAVTVVIAAAAAILTLAAWGRHQTRRLVIPGRDMAGTSAITAPILTPLTAALDTPTQPGESLTGWSAHLGNKRKQSIHVTSTGEGATALSLKSTSARDPICLRSAPVRVAQHNNMSMHASFLKSADFHGDIGIAMALTRDIDGTQSTDDQSRAREPDPSPGEWDQIQFTDPMPANAASVYLEIRGRFTGEVLVKDIVIERRPDRK